MKKAINIGIFAEDTPYEQIFACLKSAGYAAAELNLFEEKKPFPSLWNGADEAELKAVAACAAKYGIELVGVVSAAFWNHKLTAEDAQERARAAETLRTLVRAAAALGTDSVLVVPGVADGSQSYLRALENAHAASLPFCRRRRKKAYVWRSKTYGISSFARRRAARLYRFLRQQGR